jgi:hypothetical protein
LQILSFIAGRLLMTFPQNSIFLGKLMKNKITEFALSKKGKIV